MSYFSSHKQTKMLSNSDSNATRLRLFEIGDLLFVMPYANYASINLIDDITLCHGEYYIYYKWNNMVIQLDQHDWFIGWRRPYKALAWAHPKIQNRLLVLSITTNQVIVIVHGYGCHEYRNMTNTLLYIFRSWLDKFLKIITLKFEFECFSVAEEERNTYTKDPFVWQVT